MHFSLVNSSSSAVSATLRGWLKDSRVALSLLADNGTVKGSATNDVDAVVSLAPGEKKDVVFLVTWYFTAGDRFLYDTWFSNVAGVTDYVAKNYARLSAETHLFHTAYYEQTTLPYWFVQRIAMPVGTLASETSQWRTSGRFYANEGIGLGPGTCTHVYNYAQAMGRLFPELERSVRTQQDLAPGVGFQPSGLVGFRGETDYSYFGGYAADGQCGTVLKSYREHLMSADASFLRTNWTNIKKAMDYVVAQDPDADGILVGMQPQTFDCAYYGPNTFVGALYLAALRAAEEMARTMGDETSATRYHATFASGKAWTEQNLYNADGYFFHQAASGEGACSFGNNSLAGQMFGQNWAHQLGLGYLYEAAKVKSALKNVYKYNWAPDAADGPLDAGRKFAAPGEAGLYNSIYVSGTGGSQLFQNEIWTGVEYEVGTGMIEEGLLTEGLAVIRAVHDRYSATKRNPWDEVEYGEHYGRAMASWGALLAVSGYEYDGPAGHIGFAPKLRPDDFRSFFSAAQGWGTIAQARTSTGQTDEVALSYGSLRVTRIALDVPVDLQNAAVTVSHDGAPVDATKAIVGGAYVLTLATPVVVGAGEVLDVAIGDGAIQGDGGSGGGWGAGGSSGSGGAGGVGGAKGVGGGSSGSGGSSGVGGAKGVGGASGTAGSRASGGTNAIGGGSGVGETAEPGDTPDAGGDGDCACRSAPRSSASPGIFALALAAFFSMRRRRPRTRATR
jgi:MYXO-CTERM domain-containing protein